jgi:hypothetical protein
MTRATFLISAVIATSTSTPSVEVGSFRSDTVTYTYGRRFLYLDVINTMAIQVSANAIESVITDKIATSLIGICSTT